MKSILMFSCILLSSVIAAPIPPPASPRLHISSDPVISFKPKGKVLDNYDPMTKEFNSLTIKIENTKAKALFKKYHNDLVLSQVYPEKHLDFTKKFGEELNLINSDVEISAKLMKPIWQEAEILRKLDINSISARKAPLSKDSEKYMLDWVSTMDKLGKGKSAKKELDKFYAQRFLDENVSKNLEAIKNGNNMKFNQEFEKELVKFGDAITPKMIQKYLQKVNAS